MQVLLKVNLVTAARRAAYVPTARPLFAPFQIIAGGLLAHKPSELLGAAASPRSAEIGRTEAAGAPNYLTKYHFSVLSKKCTDVSKLKNGAKHIDLCI